MNTRRKIELTCMVLGAALLFATVIWVVTPKGYADTGTSTTDIGTPPKAHKPLAERPFWMKRPCRYEDSVNCFWDAGKSGNGKGHSFAVRWIRGKTGKANGLVCVFYVEKKYAKTHDYCY